MSIKSNKNNLNKKYNCHQAQKEEIQSVYALARKYLGENIASLDKMLLWHDRNPEMFNVVYRISGSHDNRKETFVRFFCLITISNMAVDRLKSKEMTGAGFELEHIMKANENPDAIYIGALVADGMMAQGTTNYFMQREITDYWGIKTNAVYSRPTTNEGMNMMEKYGFHAADPLDAHKINCLHTKQISEYKSENNISSAT